MGKQGQPTRWMDSALGRIANGYTLFAALGLSVTGVVGGVWDFLASFPWYWRTLVLLGAVLFVAWISAVVILTVRNRRKPQTDQEQRGGPTFIHSIGGGTFHASGNVMTVGGGRRAQRKPQVLSTEDLQTIATQLHDLAAEIRDYLAERERGKPSESSWRQYFGRKLEPREDPDEAAKKAMGAHDDYYEHLRGYEDETTLGIKKFIGRAIALVELASDNGYHDEELMRELDHPLPAILKDRIASRLDALSERMKFPPANE